MAQDGYPRDTERWKSYKRIEAEAAARASMLTFASPSARETYVERYREVPDDKFHLVENGFDESSFDGLRPRSGAQPLTRTPVLLHSGIVYPLERDPRALFAALGKLASQGRITPGDFVLRFRAPVHDAMLEKLARAHRVESFVEIRPPIPYREALQEMFDADALVAMQGASCNEQIPAKVYEYLRARKPVLGLADPNAQQQRIIACGQCHVTYSVMKDEGKSVDVNFPWQGGSWGNISIETIIENLETDPARIEWTQEVTGFKLGFIRHPDMEFFTDGSVHYKAGLGCPDCHMPYVVDQGTKTADHNIMSPLKRDMDACLKCHPESPAEMKAQVLAIQNRAASMLMNTGYAVAGNAKLFELLNASIDPASPEYAADYQQAAAYYRQAFYRVVYMGAENSIGFHNPSEGGRILRDAMQYSGRADALLRQIAARADIAVPVEIDLELGKYLTNRGVKPLGYVAWQTFEDPFPTSKNLWGANIDSLKSVETAEPHTMSLWETPTE